MKKILIIMAFLATLLFAQMNWVGNLDDAYDKAEAQNKIILVMLSQKGCPPCKYMKTIVFKDKKVIQEFNKNFIAVELDIHEDSVPLQLVNFGTPTFYFLNADEEILDRFVGYKNQKDFLAALQDVKEYQ
jgi:thiol:disulfide interchange protein DsbD